jgi:hypothetical protein
MERRGKAIETVFQKPEPAVSVENVFRFVEGIE